MPAVKRRYYLLIFVLVLILFGLSARLHLAELLITAPMEQAGLEDVTAEIQHLTLDQTHLSQLSFILLTDTGRLKVNAQDIAIKYLPGKLIKGSIDTLAINSLTLNYELNAERAEEPVDAHQARSALQPIVALEVLREALANYLLFSELTVNRMTLDGEPFAELDGNSLRLLSSHDAGAVYAELTLLGQTRDNPIQAPAADMSQFVITRLSKYEINVELRSTQSPGELAANIKLELNETDISGSYQLSPPRIQSWLQPLIEINNIENIDTVNGSLSLNFEGEDLLHATITASTKSFSYATYSADNPSLHIIVDYSPHEASHNLNLLTGSYLSFDLISTTTSSFNDSRIDLAGELLAEAADSWKYSGTLNSELLTASYESQQLALADISAAITADAENMQVEGSFTPATLPGQFVFVLDHKLSNGAGSLSLVPTAAIDLSAEDDNISELLTPWPYPFDLYTGNIHLGATASWSEESSRLATDISFDNTGGNIGEILFSGLSFDHQLDILPTLKSVSASKIKLATVDSGVIVSNISLSIAVTTSKRGSLPRLIVRATQGEILGGSFSGEDMVYDLNRDKNSFLINLRDIDLAEIVKTQQLEGIAASGRLDGTLPVEINEQGIVIAHGGLVNNIRGGTIRYTPETGTEQLRENPLTGITLDALRDFRYSDLQADVNYRPDGELTISLELKGISPELDENRPVHLNINTEQNLVSLLKSLRFAQGVSDSIDDQVRRIYQQSHNENQKQAE